MKTGVRHTTAILAIILVSYFMILLDNSIIFTALPKIHAAMQFSPAGLAWVQDAYTLVFGGLLLLGVRAGDLMGRRRVVVFGLAVFALASLLAGLVPAGWWLITARGVQGVGTAIVAPSSLSLLAVLGLILPTHLRGSPRPAAPQPAPGTRREPARIMTSA